MNNTDEKIQRFSFKKEERLCSRKIIDSLFTEGKSFFTNQVKIIYLMMPVPSKFPVQAAFSVGKKNFKKAVERNLIKRRMREAYRRNKHLLYEHLGERQMAVFFLYGGKTIPEYQQIEDAIRNGIQKLIKTSSTEKQKNESAKH